MESRLPKVAVCWAAEHLTGKCLELQDSLTHCMITAMMVACLSFKSLAEPQISRGFIGRLGRRRGDCESHVKSEHGTAAHARNAARL